jgi:hypothetical protein
MYASRDASRWAASVWTPATAVSAASTAFQAVLGVWRCQFLRFGPGFWLVLACTGVVLQLGLQHGQVRHVPADLIHQGHGLASHALLADLGCGLAVNLSSCLPAAPCQFLRGPVRAYAVLMLALPNICGCQRRSA